MSDFICLVWFGFLFGFALFCFVLFCFVLFCFVLFCFVLFCFVLLTQNQTSSFSKMIKCGNFLELNLFRTFTFTTSPLPSNAGHFTFTPLTSFISPSTPPAIFSLTNRSEGGSSVTGGKERLEGREDGRGSVLSLKLISISGFFISLQLFFLSWAFSEESGKSVEEGGREGEELVVSKPAKDEKSFSVAFGSLSFPSSSPSFPLILICLLFFIESEPGRKWRGKRRSQKP